MSEKPNPVDDFVAAFVAERNRLLLPVVRWLSARPWRIAALYSLASLGCGFLGAWAMTHT